jgi:2-oxoglutarate ferredoxin oxidoreductase subunit alpha
MKVLMKGNEALAEAAIRAGCRHFFGYPITPQTEVAAYMAKQMPKVGGTYLQAESEISAINMVYGAASAGKRAMTSSSSPGISLKQEGISYLVGSDLPCLIVNVQRAAPGLGGIQPSQGDYFQATKAPGHGDSHIFVMAPSSIQEMADFVETCFEKAEEYRMPSMLLADGMLGQMMEPIELKEGEPKEVEKPWALTGTKMQRPHNVINSLYIDPPELERILIERYERYAKIEENEQRAELYKMDDAEFAVVSYGASARIAMSAIDKARDEGIKVGLIRCITLWPYPKKFIEASAGQIKHYLAVEMNMGQMVEDLRLVVNGRAPVDFFGRAGGIIPSPAEVLEEIRKISKGGK